MYMYLYTCILLCRWLHFTVWCCLREWRDGLDHLISLSWPPDSLTLARQWGCPLSMSLSLTVSLTVSLSHTHCLSHCFSLSVIFTPSLSLPHPPLTLSLSLPPSLSLTPSLTYSLSLPPSLSLTPLTHSLPLSLSPLSHSLSSPPPSLPVSLSLSLHPPQIREASQALLQAELRRIQDDGRKKLVAEWASRLQSSVVGYRGSGERGARVSVDEGDLSFGELGSESNISHSV